MKINDRITNTSKSKGNYCNVHWYGWMENFQWHEEYGCLQDVKSKSNIQWKDLYWKTIIRSHYFMVGWLAYSVVTCRKYGHCWISLFFKHEAGTLYHDIFYIFIYFTSSNLRHPVHTRQSMVFNQRFFQGKQLLQF